MIEFGRFEASPAPARSFELGDHLQEVRVHRWSASTHRSSTALVALAILFVAPAGATPVAGWRENWTSGVSGWGGGGGTGVVSSNPGTGGVDDGVNGEPDGFLKVTSSPSPGH